MLWCTVRVRSAWPHATLSLLGSALCCLIRLPVMQDTPWCYGGTPWLLPGDFLIIWGARWGPLMRAQPYRWFTSWFLHESFVHILSNMLLFLVIALQVTHGGTSLSGTCMAPCAFAVSPCDSQRSMHLLLEHAAPSSSHARRHGWQVGR